MRSTNGTEVDRSRTPGWKRGRMDRMVGACALLCAALVGCGEAPPPEARLAKAHERLVEVREDVQELETHVEEKRDAVERAERALDRAREELAKTEEQLAQARARIDERATRVAIFRAVQSALLRSEALEDHAIRVEVDGDDVILHGVVDEPEQAERAIEIARGTTGVDAVVDEIRVRDAAEAGAGGVGGS